MEERWFQIGDSPPVTEGDMTLAVAELLAPRLESLGAQVFLTREKPAPSTSLSPAQLQDAAIASLADKGARADEQSLRKESERLFYRVAEIRRPARSGSMKSSVPTLSSAFTSTPSLGATRQTRNSSIKIIFTS